MEGRKAWLLALALLTGGTGCLDSRAQVLNPNSPRESQTARSANDKKACAHLYVAQAQMREQNAATPTLAEPLQKTLREDARHGYQRALENDPQNQSALLGMARLATADGDHARAVQFYGKATQINPKSAEAWYEVGMYHCKLKEWQPALNALAKASQLAPENRDLAVKYGLALARAGQTEQSVACLTRVMDPAQAHYQVARMLDHLNQPEQSKQHLRLALQGNRNPQAAGEMQEMLVRLENGQQPRITNGVVQIGFEQPAGQR